jgi:hypothetical protein
MDFDRPSSGGSIIIRSSITGITGITGKMWEGGRNVGKNMGIRSQRRGLRKLWAKAPGAPKKGEKYLKK